ncbi:coiled-coil-helix-coiled-coil-helix domain-containing protein 5 isoform X1 [Ahaetulla prasina]|uniref:coiled-coil-helix-coiled-coil-helix domain-containing protein 5 isoform X1 n=1 Tax=Ahaetulla prasina TaxID=499056 RepID=UPI0026499461|nr:coiled-coil-helix-coiled-coil-helix domain-containing protein 5 isoform X1 [Ahaetulla prasina]
MQAALEITLRYCHKEAEQYGRCVAANPSSWQQDCHQLKLDMAKCTSSHPIVQKIRQDCAEPFTAFEECLKANQSSSIKCSENLQKFLLCADQPFDFFSRNLAIP